MGMQAQPDTVLATKLIPPRPRPGQVPRTRLVERLDRALAEQSLLLVSSTAGSGKTSLLAQWLPRQPLPLAWLSLDEADADVQRFLAHLLAALERVAGLEAAARAAAESMRSRQRQPVEDLLAGLVNAITAAELELLLVLDDYHLVDSSEVHAAMAFLVEHLPPGMRLLLATRSDPPLPLGRLRLRGRLAELRAAELRFRPGEAATLIEQVSGHRLAGAAVAALVERTEGWAAGLQAAALALRGQAEPEAFVASFTGSHRYVLDFLDEEVVDRQPEALRDFLLRCSILEQLDGPLCDAVTGAEPGNGAAMLERCERENLFVVALDPERSRFAFHRLFADRLRHRLQREHAGELPELHRRAGRHFADRGMPREAIRHGLAAGDLELVTEQIEISAPALILQREIGTLARWFEALPEAELKRRPRLCITRARVLQLGESLESAERWLREAEAALAAAPPGQAQALRGQIAAVRARSASWEGDLPRTIALSRVALEALPEDAEPRAEVALSLGLAHHMRGEVAEAESAFAEALRQGRGGDRIFAASVMGMRAEALKLAGRLREAAAQAEAALELGQGGGGPASPALGRVQVVLGNIRLAQGRLEEARAQAEAALSLGTSGQSAVIQLTAQLLLAHLHEAAGDLPAAHRALDAAEAIGRGHALASVEEGLVRFRAGLDLSAGDARAALAWAEAGGSEPDPEPDRSSYARETADLFRARLQLAQGRPAEAEAILVALLPVCQAAGRLEHRLHALLLLALALHAEGRTDAALERLVEALDFAEREGYLQAFVAHGAPMTALLRLALARGGAPELAARLLGRMPSPPDEGDGPQAQPASPLQEPLTEREREVLQLLAAGYSNREIADTLVIAIGTVKRHVTNINGKLDADSRSRAVARARELGLLS